MAPPKKIVKKQQEIMIDFLEQNLDMAKGLPGSPLNQQASKDKWVQLTRRLNTVENGDKKTFQGWKRYWFTWRHRCSKKSENLQRLKSVSSPDMNRCLPLDEIEVRVLQLHDVSKSSAPVTSTKVEIVKEDSVSEPASDVETEYHEPKMYIKQIQARRPTTENHTPSSAATPSPPQWALDLEDRRIAAEERMADALESIANTMRLQDQRHGMLEERIADALTSIASTLQDINCSTIKNSLNQLQTQPNQESAMKDVIFL